MQNRKTYYYKLEDIDTNGISTFHGPLKQCRGGYMGWGNFKGERMSLKDFFFKKTPPAISAIDIIKVIILMLGKLPFDFRQELENDKIKINPGDSFFTI